MSMNRSISRVLAAAVASTGFAVPLPSIGASLSCTAGSFTAVADSSGNINVSCTQAGTTTGTCSISVSPTVLTAAGGNVTVTTSCGANASVSGGKSVTATGTNSWTDSIPANGLSTNVSFTYTVTGDGGTKSATVTEAGQGSTSPPPSGGAISCPGFNNTYVLDLPWGAPGTAAPRLSSKMSNNDIIVGRFTTPNATLAGVYAAIKGGNWTGDQILRTASLSTNPCNFPYPNPLGKLATTTQGSPSPSVNYAVGGSSLYYAILQPNTTYYFNIKNEVNGVSTCAAGQNCDFFIELQKPNGL